MTSPPPIGVTRLLCADNHHIDIPTVTLVENAAVVMRHGGDKSRLITLPYSSTTVTSLLAMLMNDTPVNHDTVSVHDYTELVSACVSLGLHEHLSRLLNIRAKTLDDCVLTMAYMIKVHKLDCEDVIVQPLMERILTNAYDVLTNRTVWALPMNTMKTYLMNDRLNIVEENVVMEAVEKYVESKMEENERVICAKELFPTIRHKLLTADSHARFRDKCLQYGVDIDTSDSRGHRESRDLVLIIGRSHHGVVCESMLSYDLMENKFSILHEKDVVCETKKHAFLTAATSGGNIYAIGGLQETPPLGPNEFNNLQLQRHVSLTNAVRMYSTRTMNWSSAPNMTVERTHATCVTVPGGRIYVIGGYSKPVPTDTMEMYDTSTRQWHMCPKMLYRRAECAACFVEETGTIIVSGGIGIEGFLSTVEKYSIADGKWTLMTSMNHPRAGHSLVAVPMDMPGSGLYVIGGRYRQARLITTEHWDLTRPRGWTTLPNRLSMPRSDMSCIVMPQRRVPMASPTSASGVCLLIGGQSSALTHLTRCEWVPLCTSAVGHDMLNKYLPCPPILPYPLSGHAAVMVEECANAGDHVERENQAQR